MVQVNPESYRVDHEIKYDRREAHGNSASKASYSFSSPKVLDFEFLFDGTGVIPPPAGPLDNVPIAGAVADLFDGDDEQDDVTVQLDKFLKVVAYRGEEHQPPNVRLIWGTLLFDCVMTSLSVDYKLFKPDGATFGRSTPPCALPPGTRTSGSSVVVIWPVSSMMPGSWTRSSSRSVPSLWVRVNRCFLVASPVRR
jgi:hypothetical protein